MNFVRLTPQYVWSDFMLIPQYVFILIQYDFMLIPQYVWSDFNWHCILIFDVHEFISNIEICFVLLSATLLNSFINYKGILGGVGRFLRIFCIDICRLCIGTVLLSSFLIGIHLISLSSLIVMARTSRTMLNGSAESGHPCLGS